MVYAISRQVLLFLAATTFALFICVSRFTIYQVHEHSMEPLLHNGQKILVIKGVSPGVGDVVIFENPEDRKLVVKRLLLSPGDPVVISNGTLITPIENLPLTLKQQKDLSSLTRIPENMFFAAGDNTFNSHDSRDYGPVFFNNLKGKVLLF